MVECEICGARADRKADIEGVVLDVCGKCSNFGNEIVLQRQSAAKPLRLPDGMQFAITEDFPAIIRRAREKRRLSQEQLASAIKEKASLIKRMEEGWRPPLETAKKLEKFLGVNLLDAIKEAGGRTETAKREVTIGDVIVLKKKKLQAAP